jgi:hypothetical protein
MLILTLLNTKYENYYTVQQPCLIWEYLHQICTIKRMREARSARDSMLKVLPLF